LQSQRDSAFQVEEDGQTLAGQLVAQLMGVARLIGFVFVLSFVFNLFVDWFVGQRVSAKSELQGLDVPEMGALAYPDFVLKPEPAVTM